MSERKKLNPTASFIVVIIFLGLIVYAATLSFSRPVKETDSKGDEQTLGEVTYDGEWTKSEFMNTPEGLPGFSFRYQSNLALEDAINNPNSPLSEVEDITVLRLYDPVKEAEFLSGEGEFTITSNDLITICEISANCFFNLPDVSDQYENLAGDVLVEDGRVTYGNNTYIKYKDPTQGIFPVTIYAIRFEEGKIFAVHHFGEDDPPKSIDLASVELIQK